MCLLHADCNVQVLSTSERCTELMKELEGSRNKMRLLISCVKFLLISSKLILMHLLDFLYDFTSCYCA